MKWREMMLTISALLLVLAQVVYNGDVVELTPLEGILTLQAQRQH